MKDRKFETERASLLKFTGGHQGPLLAACLAGKLSPLKRKAFAVDSSLKPFMLSGVPSQGARVEQLPLSRTPTLKDG